MMDKNWNHSESNHLFLCHIHTHICISAKSTYILLAIGQAFNADSEYIFQELWLTHRWFKSVKVLQKIQYALYTYMLFGTHWFCIKTSICIHRYTRHAMHIVIIYSFTCSWINHLPKRSSSIYLSKDVCSHICICTKIYMRYVIFEYHHNHWRYWNCN